MDEALRLCQKVGRPVERNQLSVALIKMKMRVSIMTDWAVTRPQCRVKDISGMTFGRLTVLRFVGVEGSTARWLFRCDCGQEKTMNAGAVKSGRVVSCGCYVREQKTKHGYYGTPTYGSWIAMIQRCENPNHPAYHRYGGRGIKVCERWRKSFQHFLDDVGPRPPGMTLDRIDNDSDYGPGLCKWSTPQEQGLNTVTNLRVEFNGRKLTFIEWSQITGIKYTTLRERHRRGWPIEKVLTQPAGKYQRTSP